MLGNVYDCWAENIESLLSNMLVEFECIIGIYVTPA